MSSGVLITGGQDADQLYASLGQIDAIGISAGEAVMILGFFVVVSYLARLRLRPGESSAENASSSSEATESAERSSVHTPSNSDVSESQPSNRTQSEHSSAPTEPEVAADSSESKTSNPTVSSSKSSVSEAHTSAGQAQSATTGAQSTDEGSETSSNNPYDSSDRNVQQSGRTETQETAEPSNIKSEPVNPPEPEVTEQRKADEQVTELLTKAATAKENADRLFKAGDYAAATNRLEEGINVCQEARDLDQKYGLSRAESIGSTERLLCDPNERDSTHCVVSQAAMTVLDEFEQAIERGNQKTAEQLNNQTTALLEAIARVEGVTETPVVGGEKIRKRKEALEDRLASQPATRRRETLQSVEAVRKELTQGIADGDRDQLDEERIADGHELCEEAESLIESDDTGETGDLRAAVEEFERIASIAESVLDIESRISAVQRSIDAKEGENGQKALQKAEKAVDELPATVAGVELKADYEAELSALESRLAEVRANQRLNGIFGSVGAAKSKAEAYVEDGRYGQAETRLESALETLDSARELNKKHNLGKADRIDAKRADIEQTLSEAQSRPADDLHQQLAKGEAAVEVGIEHREAEKLGDAVESFSTALDHYKKARTICESAELAEQWEVEQRWSMVQDYLTITEEELDDRVKSLKTDLTHHFDKADTELTTAEQYTEVEDFVSAREALESAVIQLDEATQLLDPSILPEKFETRYDQLVKRADELHEQLPAKASTTEYRNRDLLEALQRLATKLDASPTPTFVNKYGEYPADAYLSAFGSWPEALAAANLDPVDETARERRKYTRVDVLDALVDLAHELGHSPSKGEMNQQGSMSASTVMNRFRDWETALEVADLSGESLPTQPSDDPETDRQLSEDTEGNKDAPGSISPNELAELYESFGSIASVLEALLEADDSVSKGDGSPLAEWYESVYEYWAGAEISDAPNYGEQQHRRNEFSITDYRDAYGDGSTVTEFTAIETRPLRENHRSVFLERDVIDTSESFFLPVAPSSRTRLPVVVRSEAELEAAQELLAEFPKWPEAQRSPDAVTEPSEDRSSSTNQSEEAESRDSSTIVDELMSDMGFQSGQETAAE